MHSLLLIYRKSSEAYFSIEKVFDVITPFVKKEAKVIVVNLPFHTRSVLAVLKNVLFVRKKKADIYHITGDVHYAILGLPSSRTVLTIHDCVFLHQGSRLKRIFFKWLYLKMPVKRAAIVTTISAKTKADILYHCKCDPDKIIVVPNPVDEVIQFVPKKFNEHCPTILFIGSTPNKNLDRIIPALRNIECRLEIIGKINSSQREMLKYHEINYNVAEGLSKERMYEKFVECDMLLFPSTFEGFGLPIIEAQKAGRVVITSNIDPMREVAADGAMLVDPFDSDSIKNGITKVIKDELVRKELVEKGFLNIKRFEASFVAKQYQGIYNSILKNQKN
jgi:glycosyltransferase involved in cell wall biosynthesis